MKTFNFEVGKEYLFRNGVTCTVLDLDINGSIALKYLWADKWFITYVNNNGIHEVKDFDVVLEKPKTLKYSAYAVLYKMPDGTLNCWGLYDIERNNEIDIDRIVEIIINAGYEFYGTWKIDCESDGTKKKLNF